MVQPKIYSNVSQFVRLGIAFADRWAFTVLVVAVAIVGKLGLNKFLNRSSSFKFEGACASDGVDAELPLLHIFTALLSSERSIKSPVDETLSASDTVSRLFALSSRAIASRL